MTNLLFASLIAVTCQGSVPLHDVGEERATVVFRLKNEATFSQVSKVLQATESLRVGMTLEKGKENEAIVLIRDEVSFQLLQKIAKFAKEIGIEKVTIKVDRSKKQVDLLLPSKG